MDGVPNPLTSQPRRGALRALIEEIVPPPAECADTRADCDAELLAGEHEYVARAVPSRRAEFVTGRACARLALARLGVAPRPILRGPRGEPTWPRGIVGSITHCEVDPILFTPGLFEIMVSGRSTGAEI
ncbi:4'-phosphopantetheinyl transferase, partial [Frankia sp. R82]|uniref:4'-phosphopantetheinyl transferase family protein n=1 Tax=Frankia sp. R82 TaxID=2950553 RepID=UPI0035AC23DF